MLFESNSQLKRIESKAFSYFSLQSSVISEKKASETFHRDLAAGCAIHEIVDWNMRAFANNFHQFKP
jgi:hypothetical protein